MKYISILPVTSLILTLILLGCTSSPDAKEKPVKTDNQAQDDKTSVAQPTEPSVTEAKKEAITIDKTSKDTKQLTMVFEGYDEGDYPHFNFTDVKTGEGYDFRFLNENDLSGVPILLDDENSAFGYRANPKYLNKTFVVGIVKKSVLDSDLEGNTIKSREWVITSIQPK